MYEGGSEATGAALAPVGFLLTDMTVCVVRSLFGEVLRSLLELKWRYGGDGGEEDVRLVVESSSGERLASLLHRLSRSQG